MQRERPLGLQVAAAARVNPRTIKRLERHLAAAHVLLRRPPLQQLSVALVGDARMVLLHKQFLGVSGPTDVLTFPLETDRRGRVTAGEVVVCVPEARRRARERKIGVEQELLLYALHGMLHLCGYDDTTPDAYEKMHRTEDQILTRLGVGPVFDRPQADAKSRRRDPHRKPSRRPATGAR